MATEETQEFDKLRAKVESIDDLEKKKSQKLQLVVYRRERDNAWVSVWVTEVHVTKAKFVAEKPKLD